VKRLHSIDTVAVVTLDKSGGGFAITQVALQSQIVLPGIEADVFDGIIQKAKAGCPVSQVLNAEISLDYQLNPCSLAPAIGGRFCPESHAWQMPPALINGIFLAHGSEQVGNDQHTRNDRSSGSGLNRHGAERD
jgi:hypothetical protein